MNFALGFEKFDIVAHQPHSPGYIFFVGLGKVVNLLFNDANTSLVFLSIIFSLGTVILTYFLARQLTSQWAALSAGLLLIFSPVFWFYGEIATIYTTASFMAVLIAFLSYNVLKGDGRFLYPSALTLALAGGFRQDVMVFIFPVWFYCIYQSGLTLKRTVKLTTVLILSALAWLVPTIIFTGGYSAYARAAGHFMGAFQTTSILSGAPWTSHLLMDLMLLVWIILGLGLVGALFYLLFIVKESKRIFRWEYLKNRKIIFLFLWIMPALLFQVLLPLSKPGCTLIYQAGLMIILGYLLEFYAFKLKKRFEITLNTAFGALLLICILFNCLFFFYPYNLNTESTWETQLNQMNSTQKIILGIDLSSMYNLKKIRINDGNMDLHIHTIRQISNNQHETTSIVIRDITREDQGFSWRKASYYLPDYNVYYLQDYENSQTKSNKLQSNVTVSKSIHHQIYSSEGPLVEINLDPTTQKIVWVVSDRSQFYKLLKSQVPVNEVLLSNGLKIYYSDLESVDYFKVGGFVFKRGYSYR